VFFYPCYVTIGRR